MPSVPATQRPTAVLQPRARRGRHHRPTAHLAGLVTIRQWARLYDVRRFDARAERVVVYDFADLATIEGCIWRGNPVPATPEGRDELRAELATAAA
jgi:hypothetical protein